MKLIFIFLLFFQLALFPNPPISKWHGSLRRAIEALVWTSVGAGLVGSMWLYSHKNPTTLTIYADPPKREVDLRMQKRINDQLNLILRGLEISKRQQKLTRRELLAMFILEYER